MTLDDLEQSIDGEWLQQHLGHLQLPRDLLRRDARSGKDDDRDRGKRSIPHLLFAKPESVEARHLQVQDDRSDVWVGPEHPDGVRAIGRLHGVVPPKPEELRQSQASRLDVVHDEDRGSGWIGVSVAQRVAWFRRRAHVRSVRCAARGAAPVEITAGVNGVFAGKGGKDVPDSAGRVAPVARRAVL